MHPHLKVTVLEIDFAEKFATCTVGKNFRDFGHGVIVWHRIFVDALVITNPTR
jgi:hypothetical protein